MIFLAPRLTLKRGLWLGYVLGEVIKIYIQCREDFHPSRVFLFISPFMTYSINLMAQMRIFIPSSFTSGTEYPPFMTYNYSYTPQQ